METEDVFDHFVTTDEAKYPKAVERLVKDRDELLTRVNGYKMHNA